LPVHAQTHRSETEQEIAKLKQELRALEQKLRSEQDADTTKKASAEEIAKAKEQVEAFGKDAEAKHKVFEEALQRHHKAMAHLAALEGKKSFTITSGQPHAIWLEDGKANKGGKEEHRSIILRMSPDEKYDTVRGKIIELEKPAKEDPTALFFISPKENEKPGPN